MVSFEEVAKNLELRNVLLTFLDGYAHKYIKQFSGGKIDLDEIQKYVYNSCPKYDMNSAIVVFLTSFAFYTISFAMCHGLVSVAIKSLKSNKWYTNLSSGEQTFYSSYYHGLLHATISVAGAFYGFVYADGVAHTTWFHDNWYKLNMFDIQKFLNIFTLGYYAFFFCLIILSKENAFGYLYENS